MLTSHYTSTIEDLFDSAFLNGISTFNASLDGFVTVCPYTHKNEEDNQ